MGGLVVSLREIFIFGCVVTAGDASAAALNSSSNISVVESLASILLGTVAVLIFRRTWGKR